MKKHVTITSLELVPSGEDVKESRFPHGYELKKTETAQPELNRFLYTSVGGRWYWVDRLRWTYERWNDLLQKEGYETWVLLHQASVAGYFELEKNPENGVEIAYFGLMPQYIGRGLGGPLLSAAVNRCIALGAQRITVNTCTLDHSRALGNYLARGFRPVKETMEVRELPERPADPWEGATRPG